MVVVYGNNSDGGNGDNGDGDPLPLAFFFLLEDRGETSFLTAVDCSGGGITVVVVIIGRSTYVGETYHAYDRSYPFIFLILLYENGGERAGDGGRSTKAAQGRPSDGGGSDGASEGAIARASGRRQASDEGGPRPPIITRAAARPIVHAPCTPPLPLLRAIPTLTWMTGLP